MSDSALRGLINEQAKSFPGQEIVVPLEPFFEGNDDLSSIGCNLGEEQPAIKEFYKTLMDVRRRSNVHDVLVRIYDYEDPESWPFSDTVYIITSATEEDVASWVTSLLPDEVSEGWLNDEPALAPAVPEGMSVFSVWWD